MAKEKDKFKDLTIEEKISIAELALEILQTDYEEKSKNIHFMCVAIERAYIELGYELIKGLKGTTIIPELLKYKPDNITNINSPWFKEWIDKTHRIEILKKLILDLKTSYGLFRIS